MVYSFSKCTMSTADGQFILYKNIRNSWKICTAEEQNPEENALMYKSQRVDFLTGKIQFALRFKRGQLYYSPAVEEGKLEMRKTSSSPDSLGESYWFEKVNIGAGEYHALRAVSKPQVYLCLIGRKISTSGERAECLPVTAKEI